MESQQSPILPPGLVPFPDRVRRGRQRPLPRYTPDDLPEYEVRPHRVLVSEGVTRLRHSKAAIPFRNELVLMGLKRFDSLDEVKTIRGKQPVVAFDNHAEEVEFAPDFAVTAHSVSSALKDLFVDRRRFAVVVVEDTRSKAVEDLEDLCISVWQRATGMPVVRLNRHLLEVRGWPDLLR